MEARRCQKRDIQVTIRRPTSEVFRFIADGLNAPKWRTGILDIAQVSGNGVGATYKQGVNGPGGRRIDADYRVTVYEPNSRIAKGMPARSARTRRSWIPIGIRTA